MGHRLRVPWFLAPLSQHAERLASHQPRVFLLRSVVFCCWVRSVNLPYALLAHTGFYMIHLKHTLCRRYAMQRELVMQTVQKQSLKRTLRREGVLPSEVTYTDTDGDSVRFFVDPVTCHLT